MSSIPILFKELDDQGKSAKELSEATGISTGNISDWKSGRSKPSTEKLSLIAEFLNVSTDYLLGKTDIKKAPEALTDDERTIQEYSKILASLPPEKQKAILNMIKAMDD